MSHDIVLKNGLVVTPNGVIRGGIAIEGEQIVAVGASSTLGQAKREIDVEGKILFPGTFDPHVHFGISDRFGDDAMTEDFLRDTKDCMIGGVTTIATQQPPFVETVRSTQVHEGDAGAPSTGVLPYPSFIDIPTPLAG